MADEEEFKPAPWYMATYVAVSLVICAVIALVWSGFAPFLVVAVPLGSAVGLYSVMTLRLDSHGITVAKRTAPWEDLTIHRGRLGDSLRTRGDVPRSRRLGAHMPMYELHWRSGKTGACVARWAPHLFEMPDGPRLTVCAGMPHFELATTIQAPPDACFDLSLNVDLHTQSTGAREEIVGGIRSGRMNLGDDVTWKAWHFGIPFKMTSKITEYQRPARFVDEQTSGPFTSWRHEHRFEELEGGTLMTDTVDYRSPLGPIGSLVDRIRLERYMVELLQRRNEFLRESAEAPPA